LAGSERAQLIENSNAKTLIHPPGRGRSALAGFLRSLGRMDAEGIGDLTKAIDITLRQQRRPGMMVVISDFFDAGPVIAALKRARAAGHDIGLIQVLAAEDVEPVLEGDLLLEDSETGETLDLTADASALEAYAFRLAGLCEELRAFARKHGGTYIRVRNDDNLVTAIRRFVSKGVD
jgi:hypothetical protein